MMNKKILMVLFFTMILASFASADILFDDQFNRADSGTVGNSWTEIETGSNYDEIASNTLQLVTTSSGSSSAQAHRTFDSTITNSDNVRVMFSVKADVTNSYAQTWLRDSSNTIITRLDFINSGQIAIYTGGGYTNLQAYSASTYYDIILYNINLTSDTLMVSIDGTNYTNGGAGYAFDNTVAHIHNVYVSNNKGVNSIANWDYMNISNDTIAAIEPFPVEITGGYWSPNTSVYTTSSTTAYAQVNDTTDVTINYTFYKNTVAYAQALSSTFVSTTATLGTLTSVNTSQDDIFYFTAVAINSSNHAQTLSEVYSSNNITIENRLMTLSNYVFSPSSLLNNTNFTGKVDFADADGDKANLTWNLYRNRTGSFSSIATGVVYDEPVGTDIELFEIDYLNTEEGDQYYFSVYGTDGYDVSAVKVSDVKTVIVLDVWEFTLKSSYNNSFLQGVNVTLNNGTATFSKLTDSSGFVTFREDVEGVTGDTANVSFAFTDYVTKAADSFATGAHNTFMSPIGVLFNLTNLFDDSLISNFSVNISSYGVFNNPSTSLFVFTSSVASGSLSVDFLHSDYESVSTSTTFPASSNFTSKAENTYQHVVNYTAEKKILGNVINSFNVSVPAGKDYSTTSGSVLVYLNHNNYSITGESAGYVDVLNSYDASNTTGVDVFQFGSAVLNLTARSYNTNNSINNFSVLLTHSNGYSELKSTTTGIITFGVVAGEDWELFFNSDNYAGSYINITQNGSFTSYEAVLFDFNSLKITFLDELNKSEINTPVLIELISDYNSYSYTYYNEESVFEDALLTHSTTIHTLVDSFELNYPQFLSTVTLQAKGDDAIWTHWAEVVYYYTDGTNYTATAQGFVGTSYTLENFPNTQTTKKVSKIDTYVWAGTNGAVATVTDFRLTPINPEFIVDLVSPVEWLIRYSSNGYDDRTYYFNLVNNTFTNLTLYLINSSLTDTVTVTVYDEYNYLVSDAYVKILHYDITSNSYLVSDIVKTDSNGGGTFEAVLNDDFYKFIVEKPSSTIVFTSSPAILTSTTLTLQVNLAESYATEYFNFMDVSYSLTFNPLTNNFVYTYSDANNIMEEGCLRVYTIDALGETVYNSSCASGSSNTLTVTVDNSSGANYRADAFYNFGEGEIFVNSLYQNFKEVFEGGGFELFLIALLTIVFMSIGLWNPTAAILLTPLPLLLGSIVGFVSFVSIGVTIPVMGLAIIIAYIMNRG